MGTKMHRGSKRAALIGAAALPAIAGLSATLMSSSAANAAVTFSVTNQGVAHDSFGGTATGWSGYLLTIIADSGDKISALDFGHTSNDPTAGIFGALLQNWVPSKSGGNPTPVELAQNGGDYGIDSHVITDGQANAGPVSGGAYEDSNLVNPGNGVPANDSSDKYGTGTVIHHVIGYDAAHQLAQVPLAYIVLKDGTNATFNLTGAELSGAKFALSGTIPGGTSVPPPTNKIVSLTPVSGGAPTTYGNKLTNGAGADKATFNPNAPVTDSINVTGSNGSYVKGQANNINSGAGQNKFYVQATGFNPATDVEVYALDLIHTGAGDTTPAEEATVASEINASQTGTAVTAVSFANAPASLQALFPTYDIFLTTTGATNSPMNLGLDFSVETGVGGLSVTNVAAVPEPASAAGVLLGAAGLLLGRRKRNA
jgi:hypothetical protein